MTVFRSHAGLIRNDETRSDSCCCEGQKSAESVMVFLFPDGRIRSMLEILTQGRVGVLPTTVNTLMGEQSLFAPKMRESYVLCGIARQPVRSNQSSPHALHGSRRFY